MKTDSALDSQIQYLKSAMTSAVKMRDAHDDITHAVAQKVAADIAESYRSLPKSVIQEMVLIFREHGNDPESILREVAKLKERMSRPWKTSAVKITQWLESGDWKFPAMALGLLLLIGGTTVGMVRVQVYLSQQEHLGSGKFIEAPK